VTSDSPQVPTNRRTELAAFLRTQRARLTPADVGLATGSASGRRRTKGLRREEVAQLSGVGVTWYTWLEQGRDISPSAQVIDALARALRPATIGVKHPGAGLIWLQMFQLRLVDQPDLIAVIQVPADETSAGRVRSLLADA